jgi:RHS repeat-associated protein
MNGGKFRKARAELADAPSIPVWTTRGRKASAAISAKAPLLRRALACALLATTGLASAAFADPDDYIPPVRQAIDERGVDLAGGQMTATGPGISIGSGAQGLSYATTLQTVWDHPYQYAVYGNPSTSVQVVLGTRSLTFNYDSATATYVNQQASGETLIGGGSNWTFTDRDGTVIQMDLSAYDPTTEDFRYNGQGVVAVANTIVSPDKQKLTLTYKAVTTQSISVIGRLRLQSVQSSSGYIAKFEYLDNGTTYSSNWAHLSKVTLANSAVDYCNPAADSCAFSTTWPSLTFTHDTSSSPTVDTVTDNLSRTTRYSYSTTQVTVRRPSSASDNIIATKGADGRVSSVAIDGRTWTYAWTPTTGLMTATITNPDSTQRTVVTDTTWNEIKSETDELGHTTSYTYDPQGRLTDVTYPEGNKAHYDYDARGNVTTKRLISKTPGTPADIVLSAAYPTTCTNMLTCNKPTSTTDAKGKVTDYTYDSTHGGVLTVTRPAPTTGAVRPQTRYGYTGLQAYYKNSSGSIVASGQTTYLLTSISACQTTASCSGVADEVKATIGYGPQTSGTTNNLLPVSISRGSGDGALTATTAFTYDNVGNTTYVDGPLAGTADTSRILYDAVRQEIGKIGPDPDGTGVGQPNRAIRTTYNLDGQVTKLERGTTGGQSDTNWNAFSSAEVIDVSYDLSARETTRKLSRSGTAYALTQSSYDGNGRLHCSAVRMNTSAYGSLPADACTLGTSGSDGPDRISQISYDAAGDPTRLDEGVGGPDLRAERTLTYTNNGNVQTLKDADNNLTTYSYDGFDRLQKTQYPNTAQGSGTSSTTDYEQLTYDASSNVTSRRLRDATSIAYSYDNLNRVTLKNLPGSEPDVTYAYDNLGRLTSASQTGNALSFTYDALSRNLTQVGPQGTVTSAYDLAGNRTLVTYPVKNPESALSVNYDYLTTGDIWKIRENNASSGVGVLATYAYDNLGNLATLTYGNSVIQTYGIDAISRLTSLTIDVSGANDDLTIGGSSTPIAYNAASQITSAVRSSSNTAYSFTGYAAVNRSYATNGLNQHLTAGSASFSYDSKGNLTSDGSNSFCYSSENMLTGMNGTCATPTVSLTYDPFLRLYQVVGSATTRYAYNGLNIIADYNQNNLLQHRYVFGPGVDRPIVEYSGNGTNNRTFLSADERGSIVARTGNTGSLNAANAYDEYGIPQTDSHGNVLNVGLFQYTGQAWLSDIGMYYYKARIYSPTLGRFLQTDPIGYEDNANVYAYVNDDAVNYVDPLGLDSDTAAPPGGNCSPGDQSDCSTGGAPIIVEGQRNPANSTQHNSGDIHLNIGTGATSSTGDVGARNRQIPACTGDCRTVVITAGRLLAGTVSFGSVALKAIVEDIFLPDKAGEDPETLGRLRKPCGCLEAGTLVATPVGLKPIERIKVGDLVLSKDPKTGRVASKKVTALIRPDPKSVYQLSVRDASGKVELFDATEDHPWSVDKRGWIETAALRIGDRIDTDSNSDVTVTAISPTSRIEPTYNLEVADWHTFMVGKNHVVVHNACDQRRLKEAKRLFRTNQKFRDFLHREKQAMGLGRAGEARNLDVTDEQLIEIYADWDSWGKDE